MKTFAFLVAALVASAASAAEEGGVVRRWIDAARSHQPGIVDAPLTQIAGESREDYVILGRTLRTALRAIAPDATTPDAA